MWICIETAPSFYHPNILCDNKKNETFKEIKQNLPIVLFVSNRLGTIRQHFLLEYSAEYLCAHLLIPTGLLYINIFVILISSVFTGMCVRIHHAILLHDNNFICLFNAISIVEPKYWYVGGNSNYIN